MHQLKQIHSSIVINASEACIPPWPTADGLISNHKRQSLWTYTADCIPVFFADPRKRIIGTNHAGWKGISQGILIETLSEMERLGSDRNEIIVVLGPAISKLNYQVELHIAIEICKKLFNIIEGESLILEDKIKKILYLGIIEKCNHPQKTFLDIRLAAANQLYKVGLKKAQISISNLCTYSNPEIFNSWRRDQIKSSQWSSIASKHN